eukprot:CAMPEP_0194703672 /NCGR_PEP_ID=MMETSP0295-20121207/27744_1 /TAXON_ID=39354 /ORGANISM="Heterosigma akashiwo, Strain CCMP2393" /LENGTH=79 /DNA_ID=CAMNT_0039598745 /DNA_START=621 /DNA_END=860 /DNA_ORIENTATION=+
MSWETRWILGELELKGLPSVPGFAASALSLAVSGRLPQPGRQSLKLRTPQFVPHQSLVFLVHPRQWVPSSQAVAWEVIA